MEIHLKNAHRILRPESDFSGPRQSKLCPDGSIIDPQKPPIDDMTRKRQEEALIKWVADDKQAFSVVESQSFARFLQTIDSPYKLPSRRTLVRCLDDEFSAAKLKFLAILSEIPGRVAVTLDGWSSRVMKGFITTTCHWIDTNWHLQSVLLDYRFFPRPHNQITTSEIVFEILKDYNIQTRVRAATTDSGGEMPPAMTRLKDKLNSEFNLHLGDDWHVRCACHILNRAVVDAMKAIKKEVEVLREFTKVQFEYYTDHRFNQTEGNPGVLSTSRGVRRSWPHAWVHQAADSCSKY